MTDGYGRTINYLRISVTDRCDMRCIYCMPAEGVNKRTHGETLSFEEIVEVAQAAASLGFTKLRITGGEPLVRRGITELCSALSSIDGIRELAITTNAARLAGMAAELKAAGVCRFNISLDTLDAEKFRRITRLGTLEDTISGIRAALALNMPVKLNCVLLRGINDDEIPALAELTRRYPIDVRFIELMPIGGGMAFEDSAYMPCSAAVEALPALESIESGDGVARLYRLPGAQGRIGLISPLSDHFCSRCNRLRLTPDGKLKPCLHSGEEISVRALHGEALTEALRTAVMHKPARHVELSESAMSEAGRNMNEIGG